MKNYAIQLFDRLIAPQPDEAGASVWLQEEARAERIVNKQFQTAILLSHVTYERLKDRIEARALPSTGIRGKSEPVRFYEFTAWKTPAVEGGT